MRHLVFCFSLLFFFSCGNTPEGTPAETPAEQVSPTPPPAAPPLPANMSVSNLRNTARSVLRMELPNTYPEMRNGQNVLKGYSFDIETYKPTGQPVWVVQEKLYDPETKKIITGGKYLCLWANVDPQKLGYVFAEGGEKIGLVIRPKERQSFIFHPYAQELSDEVAEEVVIGWYDRVQDATLARGLVALQTLAANMEKWTADD